jgi:hypothetical protein
MVPYSPGLAGKDGQGEGETAANRRQGGYMKIREHSANTMVYFFKDPWTFILAGFIGIVLSVVTLGILGPVMMLGLTEMFYKTRGGKKAVIDDLFIHMDKTLDLAILMFLVFLGVFFGCILLIIPGLILAALWMYAPYYMAFRNMGILDSLKASAFTVNKNGLMTGIVIMLVTTLINAIGGQVILGIFITFPLVCGFFGFLFEEVSANN